MPDQKEEKQRILVISNNSSFNREISQLSQELPVSISIQRGSYEALQILRLEPANLVILDYDMPLISGEELIRLVHKAHPDTPIFVITEPISHVMKKKVIEAGAIDFVERPVKFEDLKIKVRNLMFTKAFHFQVATLRDKLKKEYGLENIIGDCDAMWKVFRAMGNISRSDVTVFLSGESGTGKEVLSRAIHRNSPRKNKPLIVINCAAIPETLLETELFGHEKGSFSGAVSQRIGKFEVADNGTIFLDEIGEMSLVLQSKILRVLEEQAFERIGGNKTIKVNVRIISATNKDLDAEVRAGRFREDLYYRIKVYPIFLPPLRERVDDIPLLVYHFFEYLSRKNNKEVVSISAAALDMLKQYAWPGNIRELENVMERAILNCPGKVLTVDEFDIFEKDLTSIDIDSAKVAGIGDNEVIDESKKISKKNNDKVLPLKAVEKNAIVDALRINKGNVSQSAKQLRIGRATLHRKLKEHNIDITRLR